MKQIIFILTFFIFNFSIANAQVAINTDNSAPDSTAMLDVKSADKGLLIPRMSEAQRTAINSPATGLLLYQTDSLSGFYYYDGIEWIALKGKLNAETLFSDTLHADFSCLGVTGSLGLGAFPESVAVSGNYTYVVDRLSDDLKVIDVSNPAAPSLTGSLSVGSSPASVVVSGNYAYVVDEGSDDLKVIDVSNPAAPSLTGNLDIGFFPNSVAVLGNYVYVVDGGSQDLKVIDVSNPAAPSLTGSLDIGSFPQSVAVLGNYAYVVDSGSDDLKVIDVSNPAAPSLTGSLGIGFFPVSVAVSGNYAYVVDQGSDDLKVIDVSNPAAPSLTGSLGIGAFPESVAVSGNYAYVVDQVSDDLKVIDVSNPAAPSLTDRLDIGSSPRSVAVSGNYAYAVDSGSEDLKVIELSCINSLVINPLSGELETADPPVWQKKDTDIFNFNSGKVVLRNPAKNGALILSPSNAGYQIDPEFVLQSAESGGGVDAVFHLSRNAIFQTSDDTYQYIDDGGLEASQIAFDIDGDISFSTAPADTGTVSFTEHLRIENGSGNVGIGRIASTNILEVNGDASKSSAGDWLANSDARLKTNIQPLLPEQSLHQLLALQGITYEWADDKTGNQRPKGIQYGFTAQNIQTVFPSLVNEDASGYLQTAYGTYDAMTVEAIRALYQKMSSQQQVIQDLQQENNQLKVQVQKMDDFERKLQGIADLKAQKEEMEKRLERLEALLDLTANETNE